MGNFWFQYQSNRLHLLCKCIMLKPNFNWRSEESSSQLFFEAPWKSQARYTDMWKSNKTSFKGVERVPPSFIHFLTSCQRRTGCDIFRGPSKDQKSASWGHRTHKLPYPEHSLHITFQIHQHRPMVSGLSKLKPAHSNTPHKTSLLRLAGSFISASFKQGFNFLHEM